MEKRFGEFTAVSLKEFEAQLIKDLRGKSLESLNTEPEPGITIKAYSHREEEIKANNLGGLKRIEGWIVRKEIAEEVSNSHVHEVLNAGVNGLAFGSLKSFDDQQKGVLFEHIHTELTIKASELEKNKEFDSNIHLHFDPIANNLVLGEKTNDLSSFVNFVQEYKEHKTIKVDGSIYGDNGASSIQELGFILGHYNEYLNVLTEKDNGFTITELIEKSSISLSITENYFVNIAKFRAVRILVKTLLKGYGYTGDLQPFIGCISSSRSYAINDSNSNLLRATTQGMSAVLGGCDLLTIRHKKTTNEKLNEIHERVAKNISLVMSEESHLDKVKDPGAGAYYIEKITNQLVEKGWSKFLSIENEGGLIVAANKNRIQTEIDQNAKSMIAQLNNGERTLLGVNKYRNGTEEYKEIEVDEFKKNELILIDSTVVRSSFINC